MRYLFGPAEALMCRLRFKHKFFLTGVLVALMAVVLIASLFRISNSVVQASRAELQGISLVRPLQSLVQLIQQHRGMSQGVLAGNEAMKASRASKEGEVLAVVSRLRGTLPSDLASGNRWRAIEAEWQRIQSEGLGWQPTDNFSRHTALIAETLVFLVDVADSTALTLDPDIDSYYLMDTVVTKVPAMLEVLGQMRATGTAALTKKDVPEKQFIFLGALIAELRATQAALKLNLEKTAQFNRGASRDLTKAADELLAAASGINATVQDELIGKRFSLQPADYFRLTTTAIDTGYRQMNDVLLPLLGTIVERRIDRLTREMLFNFAWVVVMLALLGYISMGIYRTTIFGMNQVVRTANVLSTGDLRPRLAMATRDELAQVAEGFNTMSDAFSSVLRAVQTDVDNLLAASRNMSGSSAQIDRSSSAQSDAASAMAAAVEQMTVSVDHISQNALEAERLSRDAGKVSGDGGRIVGAVVREIAQIADVVNHSANVVEELGRQSGRISAVVAVIKDIADQTNLLALNAAIEAARAGEAGRGFAVVADEVRKLAERTTRSTHEISETVKAIQDGTEGAVESMREGARRVNDGVVLARQAGESMARIQESSDGVVTTVADISTSLKEQSASSAEIARNVERIARMAEENKQSAVGNSTTAHELEALAGGLRDEINRFTIG